MLKLYQFSISHYCEKVRWALDFKGLPYQKINLVPGPHLFQIKKLAAHSTVPVLVDGANVVQDSTKIISYLEEKYPENALNPLDENLKKEAIELEEYFDREVGPHLRRFFYYYLLEDKPLVTSMLLQQAPAWGKNLYRVIFPLVRSFMKKGMKISEGGAQKSQKKLQEALIFLNKKLESGKYLVGGQFSRADLSAASLLAPLCMPPVHDFDWGDIHRLPTPLKEFRKQHLYEPFNDWVLDLYKNYRKLKIH